MRTTMESSKGDVSEEIGQTGGYENLGNRTTIRSYVPTRELDALVHYFARRTDRFMDIQTLPSAKAILRQCSRNCVSAQESVLFMRANVSNTCKADSSLEVYMPLSSEPGLVEVLQMIKNVTAQKRSNHYEVDR